MPRPAGHLDPTYEMPVAALAAAAAAVAPAPAAAAAAVAELVPAEPHEAAEEAGEEAGQEEVSGPAQDG